MKNSVREGLDFWLRTMKVHYNYVHYIKTLRKAGHITAQEETDFYDDVDKIKAGLKEKNNDLVQSI